MCVPESALRYYEEQLERAQIAYEHGFDSWEQYVDDLAETEANNEYKRMVEDDI